MFKISKTERKCTVDYYLHSGVAFGIGYTIKYTCYNIFIYRGARSLCGELGEGDGSSCT